MRYRAAYFERFPGVWCQGDFAETTEHGGFVIHGRSDATLNPGGVRIGTAEIYAEVEKVPEVREAVAIGQDWDGDVRVVLFVVLQPGAVLDDALVGRIKAGSAPAPRRAMCRPGSSRSPTSRAPRPARSPSSRSATWCTAAPSPTWRRSPTPRRSTSSATSPSCAPDPGPGSSERQLEHLRRPTRGRASF